ncbi:hypothetical protein [Oleidesulfovibrio sp.]|uniref:DUF6848 family protein n=1 Tax=Oleidesulfovibrio sp. TaxID=2909707 RepID=UPI003A842A6F
MRKGGRKRRYKVKRAYFPVTSAFRDPWEEKYVKQTFRFSLPHMTAVEAVFVLTGDDREKAAQVLLMNCIHPEDKERLEKHIRKYPAFAQSCALTIFERAIEALRPTISYILRVVSEELKSRRKERESREPFFTRLYRRFFK